MVNAGSGTVCPGAPSGASAALAAALAACRRFQAPVRVMLTGSGPIGLSRSSNWKPKRRRNAKDTSLCPWLSTYRRSDLHLRAMAQDPFDHRRHLR